MFWWPVSPFSDPTLPDLISFSALYTTKVRFLEILLGVLLVLLFNLFRLFGLWSFEFVLDFGFRVSDLVAALRRCELCALAKPVVK